MKFWVLSTCHLMGTLELGELQYPCEHNACMVSNWARKNLGLIAMC